MVYIKIFQRFKGFNQHKTNIGPTHRVSWDREDRVCVNSSMSTIVISHCKLICIALYGAYIYIYTALQKQTAVTAYFSSKQLLLFAFCTALLYNAHTGTY